MEILIPVFVWLAMAFIPLLWLKEPLSEFFTEFFDLVIVVVVAPLMPFMVRSSNQEYWVKANLKECRRLLDPWRIYIELTSFRSKENLYISWAYESHMPGRKHETRVPAYKALRELEKMPVDEWALKYLPRTEELKGVELSEPTVKPTFKPYRK